MFLVSFKQLSWGYSIAPTFRKNMKFWDWGLELELDNLQYIPSWTKLRKSKMVMVVMKTKRGRSTKEGAFSLVLNIIGIGKVSHQMNS